MKVLIDMGLEADPANKVRTGNEPKMNKTFLLDKRVSKLGKHRMSLYTGPSHYAGKNKLKQKISLWQSN